MKQTNLKSGRVMFSPERAVLLLAVAGVGVVAQNASAADIVYSLTAVNANFTGTNWAPGQDPTAAPTQPAGLTDFLYFGGAPTITTLNQDLVNAAFTGIIYNADAAAFIINGTTFTLGGNVVNNSAAAQVINPALTLDAVRTVTTTNATGTVTLFGALTGSGGLIKEGAGTLLLQAGGGTLATPVSTYSGGTTINAGSLVAFRTGQTALGTGAVTVASGANLTIRDHVGGTVTAYTNVFNLTGSGGTTVADTGAIKFFNSGLFSVTNNINISGGTVLTTDPNTQTGTNGANATVTFNTSTTGGGIHGSGGLTFASLSGQTLGATTGAAGFTLTHATGSGENDYTGDTRITSAGKNPNLPLNVTLAGNTANRLPTGTTLIFGGAYAGAPAGLDFDKSVTLTLSVNTAPQTVAGLVTANTPAAGQAYRIVSSSAGTVTFTVNNDADNVFNGIIGGTGTNNNRVNFTKGGVGKLTLGGLNTNTSGMTINAGILSVTGGLADTGAVNVNGGTYDVAVNDTVGAVTLTSGTISGVGALTATSYNVNIAAANTIGVSLAGGTLTKNGTGALTLTGTNTYTTTDIIAGTLAIGNGGTAGTLGSGAVSNASNLTFNRSDAYGVANAISGTGTVTQSGAGVTTLTGANTYTGVTTVTAGTLRATTPAYTGLLTNAGGVDVQNGGFVFDYTGGASPAATVRGLLAASFTAGSGVMNTGQIRSTTSTVKRGLGYRDDGTGTVLVQAALFGDADLDGGVSINDFNALAGNFGQSSGKVWTDGDFDYDGGISINDFNLLAGNFGQTLGAGGAQPDLSGLLAFAAAHNDLAAFEAVTGVPEPTSLALLGLGAAVGLRRRRVI